ncbi:MAG: HAD hydrolase family protein [Candidatus Ventricola sp.]
MIRLIAFDLDGTLAPVGRGMEAEQVACLRRLEDKGVRIAICSGKPAYYLCGFMRQIGLRAPLLVGENGAVIQFGVDLPPELYDVAPYSGEARQTLRMLRAAFDEAVPDLWYQPNVTALSPFPKNEAEFAALQGCIDRLQPQLRDVQIYRHDDCFDIMPGGITKRSGLERLCALLGVLPEETAAVGDGVNDYPMFEAVGLALGIRLPDASCVARNFDSIDGALNYLLELK